MKMTESGGGFSCHGVVARQRERGETDQEAIGGVGGSKRKSKSWTNWLGVVSPFGY